jgi:hypothetical protein
MGFLSQESLDNAYPKAVNTGTGDGNHANISVNARVVGVNIGVVGVNIDAVGSNRAAVAARAGVLVRIFMVIV